jgi:hypothetical protein
MLHEPSLLQRHIADLPRASPPLLLLVGTEVHLAALFAHLRITTQAPYLALSQQLGHCLLELAPRERTRTAAHHVRSLLRPFRDNQLVLLDRTALLFLPDLHLNPLQLLIATSRTCCPLLVAWAGNWDAPILTYATESHPEYWRYPHPQALIQPITQEDIYALP